MKDRSEKLKNQYYFGITVLGIAIIAFIFFLTFSFYMMKDGDLLLETINNVSEEILEESQTPIQELNFYMAGDYLVGKDIPAGDYIVLDASTVTIASSETSDIVIEDQSTKQCYIRIRDNEKLLVSGGQINSLESVLPVTRSEYSGGIYLVGRDIPPGHYQLRAEGTGSFERNNEPINLSDSNSSIIEKRNFDTVDYIDINSGEYLKLDRATTLFRQ